MKRMTHALSGGFVATMLAMGVIVGIAAPAHAERLVEIYPFMDLCKYKGDLGKQRGEWQSYRCERLAARRMVALYVDP